MYVPPAFAVTDESALFEFLERHAFAALVTPDADVPFVSHLPLLLDRAGRTLLGHVARANPHARLLAGPARSLAVFTGPHAYVSPSWYADGPAVPTWNFTAVHVTGPTQTFSDAGRLAEAVDRLAALYQAKLGLPWPGDTPPAFRDRLLPAIVGFELRIERLEGKFKLSQNRSAADRAGVIAGLEASGDTASTDLAAFMKARPGGATP